MENFFSLGSGGPGRVWDLTSSTVAASLPKENDEAFGLCRFSQANDGNQVLYISAVRDRGACIVTWNTTTWKKMGSKQIVRDAISSFSVSGDGKLVAVGTIQGDIVIVNSANMRVQAVVRKAHLGIVTTMRFSQDSRALVSASMDSSTRVTIIEAKKKNGFSLWIIIFIIIVALAAYLTNIKEINP